MVLRVLEFLFIAIIGAYFECPSFGGCVSCTISVGSLFEDISGTFTVDYGKYPGNARWHMDQVGGEFGQYSKTIYMYNDKGEGSCWMESPKVDMDKRQFTMQMAFCALAPPIMKPAVIFRGLPVVDENGNVDPRTPKVRREKERTQYDPRVIVYWGPKAYAGCAVSDAWLEDFIKCTRPKVRKIILGLDNLSSQCNDLYAAAAKKVDTKLAYTAANCTDEIAFSDKAPENEVKKLVVDEYKQHLEANLERWKDEDVSAGERRILFTHWYAKAYYKYVGEKQDEITHALKKCGMFNDMDVKII